MSLCSRPSFCPRMLAFMLRAFNENVIYRLFAFSGLCLLLGGVCADATARLALGAVVLAAILSQAINIAINVVGSVQAAAAPPSRL